LEVKQLGLRFRTRRRRAVSKRKEHTKKTTTKGMKYVKKRKDEEERKKTLLYCDYQTVSCNIFSGADSSRFHPATPQ
jgi:hypothetical protein